MANEITVIDLSRNGISDTLPAAQGVDTSTAAYVDVGDVDASKLIFEVSSTGAATGFVQAGDFTASGIGNYKVTSTGEKTYFLGPFETARFKDDDGHINLIGDTGSARDLSYRAILLP